MGFDGTPDELHDRVFAPIADLVKGPMVCKYPKQKVKQISIAKMKDSKALIRLLYAEAKNISFRKSKVEKALKMLFKARYKLWKVEKKAGRKSMQKTCRKR